MSCKVYDNVLAVVSDGDESTKCNQRAQRCKQRQQPLRHALSVSLCISPRHRQCTIKHKHRLLSARLTHYLPTVHLSLSWWTRAIATKVRGSDLRLCAIFQLNPFSSFGADASQIGLDRQTDRQTANLISTVIMWEIIKHGSVGILWHRRKPLCQSKRVIIFQFFTVV